SAAHVGKHVVGLDQRADAVNDLAHFFISHSVKETIRLTEASRVANSFVMPADDVAAISSPAQFKALGHPMRHRLLFALGREDATISQLATMLGSNKGNIAHHLKVLVDAGLVQPTGTRKVRGGTEQYYSRAFRGLAFDDTHITETAFQ